MPLTPETLTRTVPKILLAAMGGASLFLASGCADLRRLTRTAAPAPVVAAAQAPMPKASVFDRQTVLATPAEYDHVITDMQKMLASVRAITAGIATQDWDGVERWANALRPENTLASTDAHAASFHQKIPAGWRALGSPMHKGFANLADEAAGAKRSEVALLLLSQTLGQCVACHATYALKVTPL